MPRAVEEVFATYPEEAQRCLLRIRELIFKAAEARPEVGDLTECLKWGQASYLTEKSKSGSTVRIGWSAKKPEEVGVFLNCNTSLVETYREIWPNQLNYVGNREIALSLKDDIPEAVLSSCITMALTYHLNKRQA